MSDIQSLLEDMGDTIRTLRRVLPALVALMLAPVANAQAQAAGDSAAQNWQDFPIVMWQDQTPAALRTLAASGLTGGKILAPWSADAHRRMDDLRHAGLTWYCENIATDFYSAYHKWSPDKPVNAKFLAVQALHHAHPDDKAAFERDPSLSDPVWLQKITDRLQNVAGAKDCPLFINLADEAGIADLAAPWDFDISAPSLAAMQVWLRGRYGSIDALNRTWGTHFSAWADVRPRLTDDAMKDDAAVPPWMDFKAFMDTAFSDAVRTGTRAIRQGDPAELAGLEGAQPPGWGGYDYAKLAGAVDVMEIYDAGNAVEIARSFNPHLHVLTTAFGDPAERRRLWHEFLLGIDGIVVWDDSHDFIHPDGTLGPRGASEIPLLQELRGPVGKRLRAATAPYGGAAILYSQDSFRLQWLLDRRASGVPWTQRDSAAEFDDDNAWRAAGGRASAMLAALAVRPRWIGPATLTSGSLSYDGTKVLLLPDSIALSDDEAEAIRRFAADGGTVLADRPPGIRDAAGRLRPEPALDDLARSGLLVFPLAMRDGRSGLAEAAALLHRAGIAMDVQVCGTDGAPIAGVDVRLFQDGAATLVGIQRLSGDSGTVEVRLRTPLWISGLRGEAAPIHTDRLALPLGTVDPILLALSPDPPRQNGKSMSSSSSP